jgi:hypothetical protein
MRDEGKYAMFCSSCGARLQDGDRFCKDCGAALQAEGGVVQRPPARARQQAPAAPNAARRPGAGANKPKNPYRDQIASLRLQLKQLRIELRKLNSQITGTRSNYFELDSFVQRGPIRNIGRMVEGAQLFGPYQQRKQLQDQITQLEQELLSLEQMQEQWRLQQQNGQ